MVYRYNYVDIIQKDIYPAEILVAEGRIIEIKKLHESCEGYLIPGFIDAHIHIESSMLTPAQFAPAAIKHGTIATVSDPHEIANVLGVKGVEYMINNSKDLPLRIFYGAPSCVPATSFETAGASIDSQLIRELLEKDEIFYLAEMMNWPGVLQGDEEALKKIEAAHHLNLPIDGHAPGLKGKEAAQYVSRGISTDHECFSLEEATGKLDLGMKILIREGSAAKNFNALHPIIKSHPDLVMFCSDDKHPDDLLEGHINLLVKRSLELGYNLFDVLKIACINPIEHYNLPLPKAQVGDEATFIVVENLSNWKTSEVFNKGEQVVKNGVYLGEKKKSETINNFNLDCILEKDLQIKHSDSQATVRVIEAIDGELVTNKLEAVLPVHNGVVSPDLNQDILKIAVVNRYNNAPISVAFVKGFGLKKGAIASSVGHDSHNITAVGTNDEDLASAINAVIKHKGGLAFSIGNQSDVLPLPVAGLMSTNEPEEVASAYAKLTQLAHENGSTLNAPFMTLAFMSLLVIPKLKLSDQGLFDAEEFCFVGLVK